MSDWVAILEDNAQRVDAMRKCLPTVLPGIQSIFFENAREMIQWLKVHLHEVILISLDHDLPLPGSAPNAVDCGTGREVADFLAGLPPTCPVIIHSSNQYYAPGMLFAIKDAGWPFSRVYPSDNLDWIPRDWARCIQRYVQDGWIRL